MTKTKGTNEHQNVHCSLQDQDGNLWFGTTGEGVYRYDGNVFTQFTEKDRLSNNSVWSILEDKSGHIWFDGGEKPGTIESDGGIWCYDGKSFKNFNPKDVMGKYSGWSILEDKCGNIWIGTRNCGLYRYDGNTFNPFSE